MSLTSLLNEHPDLRRRLAALVPLTSMPPRVSTPMMAPPITNHYALVGTAYDYLLRFEIQRRWAIAKTEPWVAEASLRILERIVRKVSARIGPAQGRLTVRVKIGGEAAPTLGVSDLVVILNRARRAVQDAKADLRAFLRNHDPDLPTRETLARHSLKLAKLDSVYRAGRIDPEMDRVDSSDVKDLLALLDIIPVNSFDRLCGQKGGVFLNPTFGRSSEMVGGADADFVAGGTILDVKTTKYPDFRKDLGQVIGYAILAENFQREDASFPLPHDVGFYFSRHGIIQTVSYDEVRDNPDFSGSVAALLQTAHDDFGTVEPVAMEGG